MDTSRQDFMRSLGLLILRVGIGGYMMTHGWGKLQMVLDGNLDTFGDPVGLGSSTSLILATGAEFFCALLVVIGLGTRYAAMPVVFTMGVAAFLIHRNDPWTMGPGLSKEPALLFLIPFLALIFTGAGRFSLDALIKRRRGRKS